MIKPSILIEWLVLEFKNEYKGYLMSENSSNKAERRQFFRLDMEKELVDIVWIDEQGLQRTKKIACLDFSSGGFRIDCDQAIADKTSVSVVFNSKSTHSQKLYGKVLRCIKQDNGWFEIAVILDRND